MLMPVFCSITFAVTNVGTAEELGRQYRANAQVSATDMASPSPFWSPHALVCPRNQAGLGLAALAA